MWLKKGRKENKTPTCETPLRVASCTPHMLMRPRLGVIAELHGITDHSLRTRSLVRATGDYKRIEVWISLDGKTV